MKKFWKETLERAVKTAAQTAVATLVTLTTINEVDWVTLGGTVSLATLLSVLTSIASKGEGETPSLVEDTNSNEV